MKKYCLQGFLLVFLLFFSFTKIEAQTVAMKKADQLYEKYAYRDAIDLYKAIDKRRPNDDVKLKITDAYRKLNDPLQEEEWFRKVENKDAMDPLHKFYFAQALISNGKHDEAKKWFEAYNKEVESDKRAEKKLKAIEYLHVFYQDSALYTINNLPVNSKFKDFSPAYYGDKVIFVSAREVTHGGIQHQFKWDNTRFLDLFQTEFNEEDSTYKDPTRFHAKINTKFHEGPLVFNQDNTKMIFTRNNYNAGKARTSKDDIHKLKLYSSEKKGDEGWSKAKEFPYNSHEYSTGHPASDSAFTVLYFASDMPGGYGGVDLYKCTSTEDGWSKPVNLGPEINTKGKELFPFLHSDGTLYFSSDGHGGLGGLDIYKSKVKSDGTFGKVEAMSYPVNSPRDDFGFIFSKDKTKGYLSSNRLGGQGDDDIYVFTHQPIDPIEFKGIVYVRNDYETIEERKILPDAIVEVYNITKGEVVDTLISNNQGRFSIPLDPRSKYEFRGTKDTLQKDVTSLDLSDMDNLPDPNEDIELTLVRKVPEPLLVTVIGTVVDKETREPLAGTSVYLRQPNGEILTLMTDGNGNFTTQLPPNSPIEMKGIKTKYFVNCGGFETSEPSRKPYKFEAPFELSPFGLNKTFKLKNVYFDLDKWFIKPQGAKDLDKVVKLLKENPGMRVELGSHTDSRASFKYNEWLSRKRAVSSTNYIVSKGIAKSRIEAKGYGEYQLTNKCADDVECTEEEHSLNRRTEVKIIGLQDDPNFDPAAGFDKTNVFPEGEDKSGCDNINLIK